jgi:hypothetical protein
MAQLWQENTARLSGIDSRPFSKRRPRQPSGRRILKIMHKNPHVAYKVDDAERYIKDADQVIFPLTEIGPGRIAFVIKDDAIIELYEQK